MNLKEILLIFFKNDEKIHEQTYKNLSSKDNNIRINLLDYDTCIDIEKQIFSRENEEFLFQLDIKNQNCTILLKQENINVDVSIDYAELQVDKEEIILEYMIETDDTKNKIVIKKLGDENE